MVSLRVCGPKLSICCILISIWGFIMLPIMGVLLKSRSLAFAEDLIEEIHESDPVKFMELANKNYDNAAKSCYIAGAIYLGSFIFSIWQFWLNNRQQNKI